MNALAAAPQDAKPIGPDPEHIKRLQDYIKSQNIAESLDKMLLDEIGMRVKKEYEIDVTSRADWKTKSEEAMDLAMQIAKEKSFPWPKAANVIYPLVTTAATQFAARAYPAIVNGRSIVKGVVIGSDDGTPQIGPDGQPVMQRGPNGQPMPVWKTPPGAKRQRADGIGEHMSWQLLDEQPEWEPETDQLLHLLPIIGTVFRKSYFDPGKGRNVSVMVSALKCVVNYHAKSLETAPRITEEFELYPWEITEKERAGLYLVPEQPYGEPENSEGDADKPHEFLEQHRYWDLDGDNYPEPYIVTIHKRSEKVVRIVARYDEEGVHFSRIKHKIAKIEPIHYYTKYDFIPNPDGGVYSLGFGQLLRPINESINTVLNQLLDAGTLQNAGGGFVGKGLSMNAGAIRFGLGEWKTVNASGASLKDSLVPFPAAGPSPVLFELLGFLVEAGKEIAAIKDVLAGDQQNANVPATTTLALIEQGLKVFTAIYKRVHRALKSELNKLYRLNRVYGDDASQYKVGDTWKTILKQDYILGAGVEPVSDPTMVSDMQRMGRAQFLLGFRQDPNCNGVEILERAFKAADIDQIEKIIVQQSPPNPVLAIKGMEMDQKEQEIQAGVKLKRGQEFAAYAAAIKSMAEADAVAGDQHIQWLNAQLTAWQTQFEAATQPVKGADGSMKPGGEGPPPPPMAHPATIPSGVAPSSDDLMAKADPDGNGRVSPSAGFAATQGP